MHASIAERIVERKRRLEPNLAVGAKAGKFSGSKKVARIGDPTQAAGEFQPRAGRAAPPSDRNAQTLSTKRPASFVTWSLLRQNCKCAAARRSSGPRLAQLASLSLRSKPATSRKRLRRAP